MLSASLTGTGTEIVSPRKLFWYFDRKLVAEADALRDARRWGEAAEVYRRIVARRPARAGAWKQLGHCLTRLKRHGEALEAYREADRRAPDDADTIFHTGAALRVIGKHEDARQYFARVIELAPDRPELINAAIGGQPRDKAIPDRLDYVILGTTGTCNASCVHCPTGKLQTAISPRTPMPMPLFRKIIDQIADSGMPVTGDISFGLFGDGLVDPFVVERARYVRERLPDVILSVNTNGAAYNPKKHAVLNNYISVVGLHCESLVPETYDYLMAPLRAERVHAKFPWIFRDFPNKVLVTIPLSRANVDERPAMLDHFGKLGAANIEFGPLANRCADDQSAFEKLAFNPQKILCEPGIFYNLIVDCDGAVLACCNDFSRIEPVGNLATESLAETLANQRRQEMRKLLADGCHDAISTCANCRGDVSLPPLAV